MKKIVFMGTPDFAVPSLRILVENDYEVVAVVTAPDRPSGRGQKLTPSPVKEYALNQGLLLLQPEKMRDPDFIATLQALNADLMVVVAFRMLPEMVWSLPRIGTFNLHASLLPDYRGAAPINWALINGETETGATTFFIDKEIDSGAILLQKRQDIPPDWNAGDLHDALMETGAQLVLETVRELEAGNLSPKAQDINGFQHPAPKIFKEDCRIDWKRPATELHNFIRGLSPYPAAWTTLNGKQLKIYRSALSDLEGRNQNRDKAGPQLNGVPSLAISGTIRTDGKTFLQIATKSGYLDILEMQIEGKKRMGTEEFLRGFKESLENVI